jgi:hypothetical protein
VRCVELLVILGITVITSQQVLTPRFKFQNYLPEHLGANWEMDEEEREMSSKLTTDPELVCDEEGNIKPGPVCSRKGDYGLFSY